MPLIPFDEVNRRLALSQRSYLGLQEIAVDRIVGSVDRSADFRRDFRPQRRLSRSRLASLRAAFPDGVMPAINVFEVGGGYFVEDGHHRVALARERGAEYIDAEVTRLETRYEVGPDVDVAQLVHTEQQRKLLEARGLSRARPDAVIEFSFVDGYTRLAEIIDAHGYRLARQGRGLPSPEQVAADWYETVYRPGLEGRAPLGLGRGICVVESHRRRSVSVGLQDPSGPSRTGRRDRLRRGRDARARSEIPRAFATPGPARRQPTPPATTA
jgi:hypothetical protein